MPSKNLRRRSFSLSLSHTDALERARGREGGLQWVTAREPEWIVRAQLVSCSTSSSGVCLSVCTCVCGDCRITAAAPQAALHPPSWWSKKGFWAAAGSPPVEEPSRAARPIPTDANSYATPHLGGTTSFLSACQVGPSQHPGVNQQTFTCFICLAGSFDHVPLRLCQDELQLLTMSVAAVY